MVSPPVAVLASIGLSESNAPWTADIAATVHYGLLAEGLAGLWLLPAPRWLRALLSPIYLIAAWGGVILVAITFGCALFGNCL